MKNYFNFTFKKYLKSNILSENIIKFTGHDDGALVNQNIASCENREIPPDYILLEFTLNYLRDIQKFLGQISKISGGDTRIIATYYNNLWRPILRLFAFGSKSQRSINWLSHEDIDGLFFLEGFDLVKTDRRILIPFYIPFFSNFINQYIAPLPVFSSLCTVNISTFRLSPSFSSKDLQSVSVIVPARNEAGNLENILNRIPLMGSRTEVIFVEGGSSDNTWSVIKKLESEWSSRVPIKAIQQSGAGKGNAVREGFAIASNDIFMILDADLTVPPEDLPKFYKAITSGKGEFINGSRLVYPMEKRAT